VRAAHKKGESIPPFLAVLDSEKAALMETQYAMPLFKDKAIEWSTAASQISKATIQQIQPYIEAHFVVFKIDTHETEFIEAVKRGIKDGKLIRTPITPDNLKQVFDHWVEMIGKELEEAAQVDYASLFFADIMHDGQAKVLENLSARLVYDDSKPIFMLGGKNYRRIKSTVNTCSSGVTVCYRLTNAASRVRITRRSKWWIKPMICSQKL
jgi:hypothetical protein